MIFEKNTTCCLTGHRPKSLPWGYNENSPKCRKFKKEVKKVLEGAIKYGLTSFLNGMAEGFDMISAEIILELKKTYKNVKLIAVIPCLNQEIKWKPNQQKRYNAILKQCDEKIVLFKIYTPNCMNNRNKFMVENSGVAIACFNGKPSGTGNTIRLAKEKNLKIKIIELEKYN